ncbi:MAG: HD domain-containing protein [Candidatus Moranbacteria bacterium]|nr:HD domain-containing protein [Candidatus Moranbacteria bacterium]
MQPGLRAILDRTPAQSEGFIFSRVRSRYPYGSDVYRSVTKAYESMREAHDGDARDSGEAYAEHPKAVASFVIEMYGLHRPQVIIAALDHDMPEDKPEIWPIERMEGTFGRDVAIIVDWGNMRRFDHIKNKQQAREAYCLNFFRDAPKHAAVWKLGDVWHNGHTLWNPTNEKICQKALEIERFWLPLAYRYDIYVEEVQETLVKLRSGC